jgi:hypothetical protein
VSTNRTPRQSARTKKSRKISFDMQNTGVQQDMYFCKRNGIDDYSEIGGKAFFQKLKNLDSDTQILFYIYGFNNSWGDKKGHTYFLRNSAGVISPVILHMITAIRKGRVEPANRHHVLEKP